MRTALRKAVEKRFGERLRQSYPQFQQIKDVPIPETCSLYEWKVSSAFRLYIMLQVHRYEDSFTIELGWTRNGRWPEHTPLPSSPDEEPESGDMRFRIGMLWSPGKDYWWTLGPSPSSEPLESVVADYDGFLNRLFNPPAVEALLPLVDSVVEDAFKRLEEHGMPYFRKVANRQAISLEETGRG